MNFLAYLLLTYVVIGSRLHARKLILLLHERCYSRNILFSICVDTLRVHETNGICTLLTKVGEGKGNA